MYTQFHMVDNDPAPVVIHSTPTASPELSIDQKCMHAYWASYEVYKNQAMATAAYRSKWSQLTQSKS